MLLDVISYDLKNVSERIDSGNRCSCFTKYGEIWKIKEGLIQPDKQRFYYASQYLSFGDYDNSCYIERSNVRVFKETFKDSKDWLEIKGDYGSISIYIDVTTENKEIIEIIEFFLDGQIQIDEDDCNLMEIELCDKEWNDGDEVIGIISKKYDFFDIEVTDKDKFRNWFENLSEQKNIYWKIQSGGIPYINYQKVLEDIDDIEKETSEFFKIEK